MKSLFLQGYGLSIKVQNTRLIFKQGITDPFEKEKIESIELPASACDFDKVVIQGKGYVSTEALQILAENNINVVMLDKRGKLFGYFNQIRGSDPLIRQRQYDCFRDESRVEHLSKWILRQKLESQIQLIKEIVAGKYRHLVPNDSVLSKYKIAAGKMQAHSRALDSVREQKAILHIESSVAKIYYPTLALVIRPELRFNTRNNLHNFRPNNASNVINGLLNYGFAILYCEITKQLNALGLDCYYGFYHKNHESHLALVYDMIEPFRHLVDRSILEIQDEINKRDYAFSRAGVVVLSLELKGKYINLLSSHFALT
jgi:CRISPR-associated protein Cas1